MTALTVHQLTLLAQCRDLDHLPSGIRLYGVVELQIAGLLDDYGRLTDAGHAALYEAGQARPIDDDLDVTCPPLIGPWTAPALALLVCALAWAAAYAVLWGSWRLLGITS